MKSQSSWRGHSTRRRKTDNKETSKTCRAVLSSRNRVGTTEVIFTFVVATLKKKKKKKAKITLIIHFISPN